jgi:hypothetical protein
VTIGLVSEHEVSCSFNPRQNWAKTREEAAVAEDHEDEGDNSSERHQPIDPLNPDAEPSVPPEEFLSRFVDDVDRILRDFFTDPPSGVRGAWLEDLRTSWEECRETRLEFKQAIYHSASLSRVAPIVPGEPIHSDLADHGLTERGLRAKLSAWVESRRAFFRLRNVRRANTVLKIGAGLGGAWEEVCKGAQILTETALAEGS